MSLERSRFYCLQITSKALLGFVALLPLSLLSAQFFCSFVSFIWFFLSLCLFYSLSLFRAFFTLMHIKPRELNVLENCLNESIIITWTMVGRTSLRINTSRIGLSTWNLKNFSVKMVKVCCVAHNPSCHTKISNTSTDGTLIKKFYVRIPYLGQSSDECLHLHFERNQRRLNRQNISEEPYANADSMSACSRLLDASTFFFI